MKKSFEEVWGIFHSDNDKDEQGNHYYLMKGSNTRFVQDDFKSPSSEESFEIARYHKNESYGVEVFYFYVLAEEYLKPDVEELKKKWEKFSFEAEAGPEKAAEEIFGGLFYKYQPPLHYGAKIKNVYKVINEEWDFSEKEWIIETEGGGNFGEFILVRWSTSA